MTSTDTAEPLEASPPPRLDGAPPEAPSHSFHGFLLVVSVACGLSVANLYYNQPLLAAMRDAFGVSDRAAGLIPMMAQIGYALGLLLLVPLGDVAARRKLVTGLLVAVALALAAAATARSFPLLAAAHLAIGVFTVVPQVLIPFTAQLAPPAQRGKAIGTVMLGLLTGVLLSRTASGYLGHWLGWRAVYWVAAAVMVALAAALVPLLPRHERPAPMSYGRLMRSVYALVRREPVLRQAMFHGALMFGCFSAFWATLVFRLGTPPLHYGERAAGLFGLVGAAGALAAPLVGRSADRRGPRPVLTLATVLMLASFVIFAFFGATLAGLALGVILLDLATQAAQVSNQARIYSLDPAAHSRLNTAYMTAYFVGGSIGTLLGALAWGKAGWEGVCVVGIALSTVALGGHLAVRRARIACT